MGENASELSSQFGLISKASIGSIQRALLVLEQQGAEHFFWSTGAEGHRYHAHQQ